MCTIHKLTRERERGERERERERLAHWDIWKLHPFSGNHSHIHIYPQSLDTDHRKNINQKTANLAISMSLPPSRLLTLAPWKLGCFGHAVMPRAAGGLQILERRWETTELHEKEESITLGMDNDYNTWGKFPCHTALYSCSFKCCSTLGMRAKGTGHWTLTLHGVLEFIFTWWT